MGIFNCLFSAQNSGFYSGNTGIDTNPANGLPMMDGSNSVDIMGNPYGMDFNNPSPSHCGDSGFDCSHNSGFDSGGFSSGGGSSFGGGFGDGFGSGMNDW
ncbi:MAG: hypothetical protein DELT_02227 [Desulfovibrio sp.]